MESFLLQATMFLLAAVLAVPLAVRFGMGSVLGYLIAGIVIGPICGFIGGSETTDLQHFAEFGVVMMLFLIGLELEPRALWDMRHKLIGLGGLQITLTTLAIAGGMLLLQYQWSIAFAVGLIFALSSTAIVLQTLAEKGLMQTSGGRATFSVLLTQDIAVIPMLAFLPLLALPATATIAPDGSVTRPSDAGHDAHHSLSLVEGLPAWGVTLVTLGAIVAVILAGIYLIRPLFRFIAGAHLREIYTATALLIVIGIAVLMTLVGLSPALGTFLAGVVLANSEFRHELESDIEPFKGLLLGLFFITVGAQIDFNTLLSDPVNILGLTLSVIALKMLILYGLGLAFKLKSRNRWLFALGLAQAGEFGFVLISFAVQQHVLPTALSETLLLVVALSMLITPLLFILYEVVSNRMQDDHHETAADEIDETGQVIIAGIGRFGQIVNRLVRASGFDTVVLDHDMEAIQAMRKFGVKGFFGDPTRPEMLHAAGLEEARVLVVALDDPDAAIELIEHARRERSDLHIVARAKDRVEVFRLYQAGANDIVREMFDSSLRAGRYVLENVGLTDYEASQAEQTFYHHDRHAVRELALLWDPTRPGLQNPDYVARAQELEEDLQTLLTAQLEKQTAAE